MTQRLELLLKHLNTLVSKDIVLPLRANQRVRGNELCFQVRQWWEAVVISRLRRPAVTVTHQRDKEPELRDLHCYGLYINAVNAVLYKLELERIEVARGIEALQEIDHPVKHPHRECARPTGGV